jgi:cytochrome c-type biogenesis protein CcmH
MMVATDWLSASAILLAGLAVGGFFVWNVLRAPRPAAAGALPFDAGRDDLAAKRDALVVQLREIDAEAGKLASDQAAGERQRLERQLAGVLRELDRKPVPVASRTAPRAEPPSVSSAAVANTTIKGFFWGVASSAGIALLFWLVMQSTRPRDSSAAGNAPMTGTMAAATPPVDPQLAELQSAVERSPSDDNARLNLAQGYLEHEDLNGVIRETQTVLSHSPRNARALTYQALVRIAAGQPEAAIQMLKVATQSDPQLIDAWVGLAYADTQLARGDDAAAAIEEAMRRHPEEKQRLGEMLQAMRAHATAGVTVVPGAGAPPVSASGGAVGPAGGATVSVTLELDPSAKSHIGSSSVLYVFARSADATGGPPAAVKRLPPGPFPMTVNLSSADSMLGGPLPEKLRIEARIDSDGNAMTKEAGDPSASADNVTPGATVTLKLH